MELDWFNSTTIVVLALIAVAAFVFFMIWELTEEHPIVDLSLFKIRNFAAGTIAITFGYAVLFGNTVLMPMWLQRTMGYTATWSGLVTAPVGFFAILLSPVIGRNISKVDPRLLATVALVVFAICGFWRAAFSPDVAAGDIAATHLLQGIALSTFFISLNTVTLAGLDPQRIPAASGLYNFTRIMAGSFATSIWTTLWENGATRHHAYMTESITDSSVPTDHFITGLRSLGMTSEQAYGMVETQLSHQAFILSATDLFWLSGVLFLSLIALVWLSQPQRHP